MNLADWPSMTTTTPESRARLTYLAFIRGRYGIQGATTQPLFDDLPAEERAGWMKATGMLWELATTGQATI